MRDHSGGPESKRTFHYNYGYQDTAQITGQTEPVQNAACVLSIVWLTSCND